MDPVSSEKPTEPENPRGWSCILRYFCAARHEHGDHHHEPGTACMALCCARRGQRMSILEVCGDAHEAAKLRDLGIREGATVSVLRDGDPVLVLVDNARIGIGRAAANNVLCTLAPSALSSSS